MKPDANQFESSMHIFADPLKLGRSLLEGNKDHLLSQARSEFMSQTSKLDLSMIVSENFSNKLTLKAHNTEMLNLAENKLDYKKN